MIEVKEVLRQWMSGTAKKKIGRQVGVDVKTVRRYIAAGEKTGLQQSAGEESLTDDLLSRVLKDLQKGQEREHGEAWARCEGQRSFIESKLKQEIRLTKVRKLLRRNGVEVPYSTLHRFAVEELGFGRSAPTVPVIDGEPGEEVQVDTGWMSYLEPDDTERRRRYRAWIFTPHVSRHRFVYPCFPESTASAIEACEAAWQYYGGIFRVLVPDNTKAIICTADPLDPKITLGFLEYAQARGFFVDPARARSPKDKPRVERSVRDTRDDCFAGERLLTLDDARQHASRWYLEEYGMRLHSTTQRRPLEHFESEEQSKLLPLPDSAYDVPQWSAPTVGNDHFAVVAKSFYTLPTVLIGEKLIARADRSTVRFYHRRLIVKTHARVEPGKKSIDASDLPPEKAVYATRDVAFFEREAAKHGEAVGLYAKALLAGPLPWRRMRQAKRLLSLATKYGDARMEETCAIALAAEMIDVHRLERMLVVAVKPSGAPAKSAAVIPIARYLRPTSQYALRRGSSGVDRKGDDE